MSVDEITGIQALERMAPALPMKPGKAERHEFHYIRHGMQTLLAAFDVVTGEVFVVVRDTRSEEDFAQYLKRLIARDPDASRWHIVADNLNTHQSEAVVRRVACLSDIDESTLRKKANRAS